MIDVNNGALLNDIENEQLEEYVENNFQMAYLVDQVMHNNNKERALMEVYEKHRKEILEAFEIELDDPIDYFLGRVGNSIFRFVLTHPDADHFTGLARLEKEMSNSSLTISNFWSLPSTKSIESFKSDNEEESWKTFLEWRDRSFHRNYTQGASAKYFNINEDGSSGGDGISVLSPDAKIVTDAHERYASKKDIYNNASYILKLQQGKANVILGGDAFGNQGSTSPSDVPTENYMPNAWKHVLDSIPKEIENVDLLKASHHGLESGYHDKAVERMNPKITIVSEGKKQDQDAQSRYPNATLSTRWYGTIVADVHESGEVVIWTRKFRGDHDSLDLTNELGFYFNKKSFLHRGSLVYRSLQELYRRQQH